MRKPINITIDPQIDTDPAITYLIRVEGGKDQIFGLLDHAEQCGCESYEIVKYPDGVWIPDSRHAAKFPDNTRKNSCGFCDTIPPSPKAPIEGFYALIKYYDEPEADPREVFIAQTLDVDEDHPQDADVFYYAGDFPEERIRKDFAYKPNDSAEDWYIVDKVDGCGCMNSPPCLGCAPKTYLPDCAKDLSDVPVDPNANRLNLYSVWTINSDTSETEKVYIMALHEEGAACLYHQSRARDHGNILCEVVVSKVADAEVCDG